MLTSNTAPPKLPVSEIPVGQRLEPRLQEGRAVVLIVEIVGVFPNVETQDGSFAGHKRIVLIGGVHNYKTRTVFDQPGPAGTKTAQGGGGKFFFEAIE